MSRRPTPSISTGYSLHLPTMHSSTINYETAGGRQRSGNGPEHDIIGERLTINVVGVIEHYGNFIVIANIDGDFDKRGLPEPLVLAFYFTPHDDQIVQLIILRNRYDI
jgi:hypothetical protein